MVKDFMDKLKKKVIRFIKNEIRLLSKRQKRMKQELPEYNRNLSTTPQIFLTSKPYRVKDQSNRLTALHILYNKIRSVGEHTGGRDLCMIETFQCHGSVINHYLTETATIEIKFGEKVKEWL
jgi:hypothetical protein